LTSTGAIHLHVTPGASSLDFVHGITVSGITLPGITTRRSEHELDVANGQSFAISGLVDAEVIKSFARLKTPLPPMLTFNDPQKARLLVIVTPEIVAATAK
jgi:pilus assembly protein CpaC